MGILSSIKNKIYGRNKYEDIRNTSRGDTYNEGDSYAQKFRESNFETQQKDPYENHRDHPISNENIDSIEQPLEPVQEPLPRQEPAQEPVQDAVQEPVRDVTLEDKYDKRYEIEDRLNIIEAQLQAIRSQTETINERLKNIDSKFGRRF